MNFYGLLDCLRDVVRSRSPVEMDGNRMLSCIYLDDGRRYIEESLVLDKVRHPQSCGHDH